MYFSLDDDPLTFEILSIEYGIRIGPHNTGRCVRHEAKQQCLNYIPTLAVLKPFRRRGLGQALLQHAFQALQERGVQRVGMDVDAKNKTGANRLYPRVGMHVDQEIMHYEIELRPGRELAVVE